MASSYEEQEACPICAATKRKRLQCPACGFSRLAWTHRQIFNALRQEIHLLARDQPERDVLVCLVEGFVAEKKSRLKNFLDDPREIRVLHWAYPESETMRRLLAQSVRDRFEDPTIYKNEFGYHDGPAGYSRRLSKFRLSEHLQYLRCLQRSYPADEVVRRSFAQVLCLLGTDSRLPGYAEYNPCAELGELQRTYPEDDAVRAQYACVLCHWHTLSRIPSFVKISTTTVRSKLIGRFEIFIHKLTARSYLAANALDHAWAALVQMFSRPILIWLGAPAWENISGAQCFAFLRKLHSAYPDDPVVHASWVQALYQQHTMSFEAQPGWGFLGPKAPAFWLEALRDQYRAYPDDQKIRRHFATALYNQLDHTFRARFSSKVCTLLQSWRLQWKGRPLVLTWILSGPWLALLTELRGMYCAHPDDGVVRWRLSEALSDTLRISLTVLPWPDDSSAEGGPTGRLVVPELETSFNELSAIQADPRYSEDSAMKHCLKWYDIWRGRRPRIMMAIDPRLLEIINEEERSRREQKRTRDEERDAPEGS